MIALRQLVEAGVQFGHVVSKRNPKMDEYIWGKRSKVQLIDVSKTARQLERAATFLEGVATQGRQVLWVGTKKVAQAPVRRAAEASEMPYVDHRWIGGTLSNYAQVKKSLTKLLRYEEILAKPERYPYYTKKELNVISKTAGRLAKLVGGVRELKWPVGAIVLVDIGRSESALREAVSCGVPVVAIVDTDCDPSLVDYVIPSNDDAPAAVNLLVDYLGQATQRGQAVAEEERKKVVAAKKEEAVKKKDAAVADKASASKVATAKKGVPSATPTKAVEGKQPAKEASATTKKPAEKVAAPKKSESGEKKKADAAPVKKSADKKASK